MTKHLEGCFIYDDGPCDCGVEEYITGVTVTKHLEGCFIYDNGPCDCGVEKYMTDEEIDNELLEKEEAKD